MSRSPCTQCGQHIEFPEALAGQEVECPTCGRTTRLGWDSRADIRISKLRGSRFQVRQAVESSVRQVADKILANVGKVVVGKETAIQLALTALLAEGHVLVEDVPGVAKTMLGRALAQSSGCRFKRVQCTPDLLPTDITGASVFNPQTTEFSFRPGPIFSHIVLADEINRTTPRTQSALLEAMAERHVTVDGENHELEQPFFLIATQNPVEHEGTFPLPEAQLDRFLIRLNLGYPSPEEESRMLERLQLGHPIESLEAVATAEEIVAAQMEVRKVQMHEMVREYVVRLVRATREHPAVRLGGSPRATLALFRASQAFAALQGYDFVMPDDVKELTAAVLGHRLILRPESRLRKMNAAAVLAEILSETPVPTLTGGGGR